MKQRKISTIRRFILQMLATAEAKSGTSRESAAPSGWPMWGAGIQVLGSLFPISQHISRTQTLPWDVSPKW